MFLCEFFYLRYVNKNLLSLSKAPRNSSTQVFLSEPVCFLCTTFRNISNLLTTIPPKKSPPQQLLSVYISLDRSMALYTVPHSKYKLPIHLEKDWAICDLVLNNVGLPVNPQGVLLPYWPLSHRNCCL